MDRGNSLAKMRAKIKGGNKLEEIISLILAKRWGAAAVAISFVVMMAVGGMAMEWRLVKVIRREVVPEVQANGVRTLENGKMITMQIQSGGIAAYKKFDGLSGQDLVSAVESNTQNACAAEMALNIPDIRTILFQMNRALTIELLEYFKIE